MMELPSLVGNRYHCTAYPPGHNPDN